MRDRFSFPAPSLREFNAPVETSLVVLVFEMVMFPVLSMITTSVNVPPTSTPIVKLTFFSFCSIVPDVVSSTKAKQPSGQNRLRVLYKERMRRRVSKKPNYLNFFIRTDVEFLRSLYGIFYGLSITTD